MARGVVHDQAGGVRQVQEMIALLWLKRDLVRGLTVLRVAPAGRAMRLATPQAMAATAVGAGVRAGHRPTLPGGVATLSCPGQGRVAPGDGLSVTLKLTGVNAVIAKRRMHSRTP